MIGNKPLTQSAMSDRIWNLAGEDMDMFNKEAERYFALGYPRYTIARFDFNKRVVWLRDDR